MLNKSNLYLIVLSGFVVCSLLVFTKPAYAALGSIVNSWNAPAFGSRGLAWDGTNIWYSNSVTDTVYKLDPANGNILDSFASANVNPWDLTFVGGTLWNIDGFSRTFYSVDPGVGPPWNAEFTKPANDYFGLAYDGTNLWASDINWEQINKMDMSGNVLTSFPAPDLGTAGLAWDGTYLWNSDTNTDLIYKIDPATGNVLDSFAAPGSGNPQGLTFDGTYLWSTDAGTNVVYQLDIGLGATPVPPGIVTLLTMLGGLGGYAGLGRLKRRKSESDAS